ncbi:MAG TPA: 4-hydroxy-3-methylbut-2-enyl diphosphate reductase [Vicinamibacterales bacterium]|nr:4-hydroxy-3-methylbut-2-enyl diphosphate reductase [Vicinamibacterales bacterium]
MPPLIFRKGLDRKQEVAGVLAASYHSDLIAEIKAAEYRYQSGRLTIHLAREFGFCYGVDRAVDYAYQTRQRFEDRPVFLTGEIIHNPHVNRQIRAQGVRFLTDPGESIDALTPKDVVILPAFGITIELLETLVDRGCTLVDTTCGSVLNVWKNVKRYAEQGFTSIIHGKYWHEETRATASQAQHAGKGHYLVVLDRAEAGAACEYIRRGGGREEFLAKFEHAVSPGFDPDVDLGRIGCANQTTMLSSESLEIGDMFRGAIGDRYGAEAVHTRYRAFDTICSATQDRQDAIIALLDTETLDAMIVLGGYNSSNTCNLARICAEKLPTYHIADPEGLTSATEIRHKPVSAKHEVTTQGWLPASGISIGLTSGASTPDNLVETVIRRLDVLANGE